MAEFERCGDLINNRRLIADPEAFARDAGAASWLYLCGEDFASMEAARQFGCDSSSTSAM
jgi:hypothetical protein